MRLARMAHPVLPICEPRIPSPMPVSYLPSQIDGGASSTPLNFRDSPFKLLWADIKLVVSLLSWLPHIFVPAKTTNPYSELYPSWMNMRDLIIQLILGFLGIIFLIVVIPLGIAAPGGAFAIFMGLYCGLVWLLCLPLKGPRVINSNVDLEGYEVRKEENWVFINGVAAGNHWLQANIDMLSSIFKRPVVGIHNRTYGTVFDLIECLVQRCFSYSTKDTRITYQHLKSVLMDPKITKVVVIAHSQGGIILSTALDCLLADVPSGIFDKLEIYTFGCAANHFNNPVRFVPAPTSSASASQTFLTSGASNNPPRGERLIRHIEHYANEQDFVSLFGVLHFTRGKPSNRFVGKVFENKGNGGHLLNQHYLDRMFVDSSSGFLDQIVDIDETTAVHREEETEVQGIVDKTEVNAWMCRGTSIAHGVEGVRAESLHAGRQGTPGSDGHSIREAKRSVDIQRGKKVRELSRLWIYRDGESPVD